MSTTKINTLLAISALVISLVGCSDSDPIRGKFVAGCMHAGAPKTGCLCIYKKLEEQYGQEELERLSMEYPPKDTLMKSTMAAALACRS